MNGVKHSEATQPGSFWESMVALGEDPQQFEALLAGLIGSLRPVGVTEMMLVGDVALLAWKKARLERAEHGAWECNIEKLERERRALNLGHETVDSSHAEVMRCGLRGLKDSPAKFDEMLSTIRLLANFIRIKSYGQDVQPALEVLYGQDLTLRGILIQRCFADLRQAVVQPAERQDAGRIAALEVNLKQAVMEEMRDVS